MTCPGTVYSYAQLEGLWIKAGGPKAVAPVAAAIAEAESSGCSAALNPTDNNGKQTSVGLWQVSNGTHQYPASWLQAGPNAAEAVAKYKGAGNSFSPWGTYDSGAYKAFLNGSTTPDTNVPGSGTAAGSPSSGSGSAATGKSCMIQFPGVAGVGKFCILSKGEARALIGGGLIVMAAGVGLVGAVILAAAAFNRTGALQKTADMAAVLPGGGAAAEGLTRAHSRVTRSGSQAASQRAGARATAQRQADRQARQAAATQRRAARPARPPRQRQPQPQGRHARTGPNAPAQGRHAAPAAA